MSGFDKRHLDAVVAGLEAEISSLPAPKDLVLQVPAFTLYGFPPVPNPLTPEHGKVYLFEFLLGDQTVLLPTGVDPGYCFELWGVELNSLGPYRLEVVAPGAQLVVGDCVFGTIATGLAATNKFVIDGDGPSHEAVRLTFLGPVDYSALGGGIFELWKMERLDEKSDTTKLVHYATAAALPSYTSSGEYGDRVLAASGAGQLTIDGRTYTTIEREKILVKDEGDNDIHGIYWLTQVDPWKLRRASIDQNEFQVNRRGSLIQVMFGTANAGKQFFRDHYTSNVNPVASGGEAGPIDNTVYLASFDTPYSAAARTFVNLHVLTGDATVNIPDPSTCVGEEIWIKLLSVASPYKCTVTPAAFSIDKALSFSLANSQELVKLRATGPDSKYPGTYYWARVSEVVGVAGEVNDDVPIGPTDDYQPACWYEKSFFNLSANLGPGVINSFKWDAFLMKTTRKLIRNRTSNSITIKNNQTGTGKVLTKSGSDVVLPEQQTFEMVYSPNSTAWVEV